MMKNSDEKPNLCLMPLLIAFQSVCIQFLLILGSYSYYTYYVYFYYMFGNIING